MEEFPNYMAFNPENHQLCHSTTLQCGRKNYPLCRRWGRWLGCDLAAGHRLVPRTMQRLFLLPSWRRRPSSAPPLSNSRSGFHGQIRSNSLLSPSQEKKILRAIYISHRSCSTFFHPFAMARILLAFAGDRPRAAVVHGVVHGGGLLVDRLVRRLPLRPQLRRPRRRSPQEEEAYETTAAFIQEEEGVHVDVRHGGRHDGHVYGGVRRRRRRWTRWPWRRRVRWRRRRRWWRRLLRRRRWLWWWWWRRRRRLLDLPDLAMALHGQ